ncbi:MAG TPA: alpha/beta hydrolase [Actinomycetota bacterium]|nr:alpha/beta hydrolase [Actinomycetota bacterium]
MATFAFVHGAFMRGAHFAVVAERLRGAGHRTVAPDLPATDPAAGAAEYARLVAAAAGDTGDLVVVAHSMGGLTAPVVATLRPVRRIVYLAALVPEPGRSFDDVSWHDPRIAAPYVPQTHSLASEDGSASVGPARAAEVYFHDASPARRQWAYSLMRPQQWKILREPCPLDAMPSVDATVVACRQDRLVSPSWLSHVASERLGTEAITIDGGHCPMVSRPGELVRLLIALA